MAVATEASGVCEDGAFHGCEGVEVNSVAVAFDMLLNATGLSVPSEQAARYDTFSGPKKHCFVKPEKRLRRIGYHSVSEELLYINLS